MVSLKACNQHKKTKVVFVMGATGTGKSKLAIDLATSFNGEVINSDKIQVYQGLDIVTNKVAWDERAGVPHHLLGCVHPDADFTASDFARMVGLLLDSISARGKLAIVAGGSNSYIKELLDGNDRGHQFRSEYECCFLWVDVKMPVIETYVSERVDKMMEMGLVEEVRANFNAERVDYSKGIHRAIGVPELDEYFRGKKGIEEAIEEMKRNTWKLVWSQLDKIRQLRKFHGWDIQRVDATDVFKKKGKEAEELWKEKVAEPSRRIVREFLNGEA